MSSEDGRSHTNALDSLCESFYGVWNCLNREVSGTGTRTYDDDYDSLSSSARTNWARDPSIMAYFSSLVRKFESFTDSKSIGLFPLKGMVTAKSDK